jgi:hypothetical protein
MRDCIASETAVESKFCSQIMGQCLVNAVTGLVSGFATNQDFESKSVKLRFVTVRLSGNQKQYQKANWTTVCQSNYSVVLKLSFNSIIMGVVRGTFTSSEPKILGL